MRYITTLFLATLLLVACNKSGTQNATPANNNPSNNTPSTPSPYYFKFNFDGKDYNYTANNPQYMGYYGNVTGGYQTEDKIPYATAPSISLALNWNKDTVTHSQVMAVKGKTFYFNDTLIKPEITFKPIFNEDEYESIDTSNTNFSVTITDVKYRKRDTAFVFSFFPVETYIFTGTCSAVLEDYWNGIGPKLLTNGSFNIIVSRRDY